MSDFFVMPQYTSLRGKLVLKTVIYKCKPRMIIPLNNRVKIKKNIQWGKLLGFQNFACLNGSLGHEPFGVSSACLKLEHYESDTDFIDRL